MICDDAINNWKNAMPQRTKTKQKQNRGNENKRIQVEIQHHCHEKTEMK